MIHLVTFNQNRKKDSALTSAGNARDISRQSIRGSLRKQPHWNWNSYRPFTWIFSPPSMVSNSVINHNQSSRRCLMNEEREFYERIAEVFAAPRLRPPIV
jgi:hypothetical protein